MNSKKFLLSVIIPVYNEVKNIVGVIKMLSKKVYPKLKLSSNRFEIEIEFTSKILKNHFKIVEVPIVYKSRGYDEGKKINWKDGVRALGAIIKFRFGGE